MLANKLLFFFFELQRCSRRHLIRHPSLQKEELGNSFAVVFVARNPNIRNDMHCLWTYVDLSLTLGFRMEKLTYVLVPYIEAL